MNRCVPLHSSPATRKTREFLQTDPERFSAGDVNIYRYVGNNPLNLTDAMGLDPATPGGVMTASGEGIEGAVGGYVYTTAVGGTATLGITEIAVGGTIGVVIYDVDTGNLPNIPPAPPVEVDATSPTVTPNTPVPPPPPAPYTPPPANNFPVNDPYNPIPPSPTPTPPPPLPPATGATDLPCGQGSVV